MSFLHPSTGVTNNFGGIIVSFNSMFSFCSSPANSNAGVRFNNDGTVEIQDSCGGFSFDQNYLSVGGGTEGDDFEIMCEPNFQNPNSGDAINTWLPLTSNRQWVYQGFNEFNSDDWTITVREVLNVSNNDFADYDWEIEDGS